ncbi:hypothetical protein E3U43_013371 [Larimichthys crocea]|uniref:Uncharacterized protein n=1 Tax=Larimichthys crocea TaxID=215358 RepID=A0ACD3R9J4_LARCR|nr:hypothetical protein E3U43_013371 [Larimichthys crocea]
MPHRPTRARSPSVMANLVMKTDLRKAVCARALRAARKSLLSQVMGSSTAAVILEMLMFLMEAIQTNFQAGISSRKQQPGSAGPQ